VLVFNSGPGCKLTVLEGESAFVFWMFSLCFENLLPLFASAEISLLQSITDTFKVGKVYPGSTPLAEECQRLLTTVPAQFNLDHRGQLVRIAASILSVEFNTGLAQRSGRFQPEDHVIQVFEKLSASELISLSVGELAARFNCSRRHLNRLFHQHFGVSVASLRMEMRLLKAVSLLRDPNAKVINVAEECGFNHLGLFNTCFKRRFGASPGQWRKENLRAQKPMVAKPEKHPICPLQSGGICPLSSPVSGGSGAGTVAPTGGTAHSRNVLGDLKRRGITFGAQALTDFKPEMAEARENS